MALQSPGQRVMYKADLYVRSVLLLRYLVMKTGCKRRIQGVLQQHLVTE